MTWYEHTDLMTILVRVCYIEKVSGRLCINNKIMPKILGSSLGITIDVISFTFCIY